MKLPNKILLVLLLSFVNNTIFAQYLINSPQGVNWQFIKNSCVNITLEQGREIDKGQFYKKQYTYSGNIIRPINSNTYYLITTKKLLFTNAYSSSPEANMIDVNNKTITADLTLNYYDSQYPKNYYTLEKIKLSIVYVSDIHDIILCELPPDFVSKELIQQYKLDKDAFNQTSKYDFKDYADLFIMEAGWSTRPTFEPITQIITRSESGFGKDISTYISTTNTSKPYLIKNKAIAHFNNITEPVNWLNSEGRYEGALQFNQNQLGTSVRSYDIINGEYLIGTLYNDLSNAWFGGLQNYLDPQQTWLSKWPSSYTKKYIAPIIFYLNPTSIATSNESKDNYISFPLQTEEINQEEEEKKDDEHSHNEYAQITFTYMDFYMATMYKYLNTPLKVTLPVGGILLNEDSPGQVDATLQAWLSVDNNPNLTNDVLLYYSKIANTGTSKLPSKDMFGFYNNPVKANADGFIANTTIAHHRSSIRLQGDTYTGIRMNKKNIVTKAEKTIYEPTYTDINNVLLYYLAQTPQAKANNISAKEIDAYLEDLYSPASEKSLLTDPIGKLLTQEIPLKVKLTVKAKDVNNPAFVHKQIKAVAVLPGAVYNAVELFTPQVLFTDNTRKTFKPEFATPQPYKPYIAKRTQSNDGHYIDRVFIKKSTGYGDYIYNSTETGDNGGYLKAHSKIYTIDFNKSKLTQLSIEYDKKNNPKQIIKETDKYADPTFFIVVGLKKRATKEQLAIWVDFNSDNKFSEDEKLQFSGETNLSKETKDRHGNPKKDKEGNTIINQLYLYHFALKDLQFSNK